MSDLLHSLDNLHTTALGVMRIRRNLNLPSDTDVVAYCQDKIKTATITRQGKNYYAHTGDEIITVNAGSLTIITAHLVK